MSREKNGNMRVLCSECNIKLKKDNLRNHLKLVHNKKIEYIDESSVTLLPKKEQNYKKATSMSKGTIAIIAVLVAIVVGVAFFAFYGLSDGSNTPSNGNGNNKPDTDLWLDDYTPMYDIGTGSNDFWIAFPTGNPSVGQSVQHKTWVTESLEEKPVFFVCHRTGCVGCADQAERVKDLGEKYSEYAIFYDLDDPYPGYVESSADILDKYHDAFYYDPNGGTHYIALTGVFTIINEGGEEKIGWHSWEGNVDDVTMENWIKDAIYYHNVNK
ncbi:MAG: hypothetical protein V1769_01690 [Thermoplasmatota archaeon]